MSTGTADSDDGETSLGGRSAMLAEEFCRETGWSLDTVASLVRSGRLDGLLHLDDSVFGVFNDVLPTREELESIGPPVLDGYDPEALRSRSPADGDEWEPGDGSASWTMAWGDDADL